MSRLFRGEVPLASAALMAGILLLASCGKPVDESQEGAVVTDNPYPNFRGSEYNGEKNFAKLVNEFSVGKSEPTPWAGYWWPYTGNGIASGTHGGGLSPAGKYDAARGGQTGAQSWEAQHHGAGVKGVQGWWGHCNGWCAASALYPEPKEDIVINGVHFGVADQKALLSEAGMSASADYYGNRVDWANDYNTPKYYDTVPDQYFLVLTNYIGRLKQGVLIDRFTGDQVWNQPLAGYKIEYPKPADYLGADPKTPNIYRIVVESTIWWAEDGVAPDIQTPEFTFQTDSGVFTPRTLKMEVWLDGPVVFGADGKIQSSGNVVVTRQGDYFVGGSWLMGEGIFNDAWPDYMWVPYSLIKPDPTDDYANPHVEIAWLKKHLLVPGGADDPSAHGRPVDPAPTVQPSGSPSATPTSTPTSTPTQAPTNWPTSSPSQSPPTSSWPFPMPTFTSRPAPTSTATSTPLPPATETPQPFPFPTFTNFPRPDPVATATGIPRPNPRPDPETPSQPMPTMPIPRPTRHR